MEQDQNARVSKSGDRLLTDRLKEIWRSFMEEFQQSFDLEQLDTVLSQLMLRDVESTSSNPKKKKRLEFMHQDESIDNEDNDLSSLEKKVFGNHLLAKSIFKNISRSDLLSCRLMNSYWNEYATELVLKKDSEIEFGREGDRFVLRGSNWKSLDMFTQLLGTSKKFPCNKFVFWGGNLGNDDAQRFFNFYGSSIKSITIRFDDGQRYGYCDCCSSIEEKWGYSLDLSDSKVIGRVLSQHLPNLEHLELNVDRVREFHDWSEDKCHWFPPEEKVELPNLKSLTVNSIEQDYDFLLRELLEAATNLERFYLKDGFLDMDGLDNLVETGKVKCVTSLAFPVWAEELDQVEEMLKHEPKLSSLSLQDLHRIYKNSDIWKKISIVLAQLFNCNQTCLRQITAFRGLGFLSPFQLPIFKHVEELELFVFKKSTFNVQDIHEYTFACLPEGATFSKNFPKLSEVEIRFCAEISNDNGEAAEWWSTCFPTDEIVPTVKELVLNRRSCPLLWLEKFSKMFPNVQELSVSNIKDFPNFSKILWTSYTQLKNLAVEIDLSSPLNSYPALDSSFTGLSTKTFKKLVTLSASKLKSMAKKHMKDQPSLLNLKDLKTLQINLKADNLDPNSEHPKILSLLTGMFVFEPLENLEKVSVQYPNMENPTFDESLLVRDLELLAPYKVVTKKAD